MIICQKLAGEKHTCLGTAARGATNGRPRVSDSVEQSRNVNRTSWLPAGVGGAANKKRRGWVACCPKLKNLTGIPWHRRLRSHKRPPLSLRQCRVIEQCHPHTPGACWRRRSSKQEALRLGGIFDHLSKIGGRKAHLPWHRRPRSHKRPPPSLRQCRAIA